MAALRSLRSKMAGRVIPNAASVAIAAAGAHADTDIASKGHPSALGTSAAKQAGNSSLTATEQHQSKPPPAAPSSSTTSRKNASGPSTVHRDSTFRAVGSLMLRPGTNQINVLRTSLDDINERVKYRWVLHPMSHFKTAWDLLSAFAVVYYSWMIPFMLCFEWVPRSERTTVILRVLDVWGTLDVLLRFRTGIIEYGSIVMNPKRIRDTYVKSVWFPIDLVSTIPFEIMIQGGNVSTRKTIKMIKYVKLPRLLRIGRFLKYVRGYKRYSSLVIALNSVLFVSHVAGCIWVAVLQPCDSAADVPGAAYCAADQSMHVYWIAFHHGIVSLLGISSDHIESREQFLSGGYHHQTEWLGDAIYIWSSIVSVTGAVVTAVLFGTVIQLVQSWNRAENTFRKKMDQISHEMEALSLPRPLRARVNAYYDYLWLNSRTFSEELDLLKDKGMSVALRQQIAIYLFKDYLQKIPFFQLATDTVLGMICMQLHPVIYMPDDYIIREGDIGKELFMIVKGVVQVMPPKHASTDAAKAAKKILLGEGNFFGEIGVVMEVERTRSVKAECMAELCILSRDGFDKILVEFPEFAMAMKKLIIKRVGEMLDANDDPARMEKMTKLADLKMKRTMQTHSHVQKLRGSAHLLHAFRSSASTAATTMAATADASSPDSPSAGDTNAGAAQYKATATAAATSAVRVESLTALEPIAEQVESDTAHAAFSRRATLSDLLASDDSLDAASDLCDGAKRASLSALDDPHLREPAQPTSVSAPSATAAVELPSLSGGGGVAAPESKALQQQKMVRKVEKVLQQLERKVESRLSAVDAKISQVLSLLVQSRSGDGAGSAATAGRSALSPSPLLDAMMNTYAEEEEEEEDDDEAWR